MFFCSTMYVTHMYTYIVTFNMIDKLNETIEGNRQNDVSIECPYSIAHNLTLSTLGFQM